MPVLTFVYDEIKKAWVWVKSEATDIYNMLEPLVSPALVDFDSAFVQDLWGAAAAFVSKVMALVTTPTGILMARASYSGAISR